MKKNEALSLIVEAYRIFNDSYFNNPSSRRELVYWFSFIEEYKDVNYEVWREKLLKFEAVTQHKFEEPQCELK